MHAWQVTHWGEPEEMDWADVPVPTASPGHLVVRVHAAALNFFDILQVQGKYQIKPPFPFTPGAEIAGTVEQVGEGVTGLHLGDRVMAMASLGGLAEFCSCETRRTWPLPPSMSFVEGAAFPIVYHTSYFGLVTRGHLQPGETLLVHAGASGVGMSAIQIGKALGARVIATAGSAEKLAFARQQGADEVLDYTTPAWVDEVKRLTGGHGANVIYDPVGGDIFDLSTKCIASEGRLLVIGFASGRIPSLAVNRALLKNMSVVGVLWGGYVAANPEYLATCHNALMQMYAAGHLHPRVGRTYPLREGPGALRDLANRRVLGKAVLTA
jgi:NADPH2:quinone reductase